MPSVFNPYAGKTGATRRANLTRYLCRMAGREPLVLLVGEALGYRGGRVTGVPFTSQALLLRTPSPFDLLGSRAGFSPCPEAGAPLQEATASIIWETLERFKVLPLLWNAFPFHPYQPDNPFSNRTPTRLEIAAGRQWLNDLLGLFAIDRVIAVGKQASRALTEWNIPAGKVRHPAHGGKAAFTRELAIALNELGQGNGLMGSDQGSRDEK